MQLWKFPCKIILAGTLKVLGLSELNFFIPFKDRVTLPPHSATHPPTLVWGGPFWESEFCCICFIDTLSKTYCTSCVSIATLPTHVFRIQSNAESEAELE